jgi:hypothetical protein
VFNNERKPMNRKTFDELLKELEENAPPFSNIFKLVENLKKEVETKLEIQENQEPACKDCKHFREDFSENEEYDGLCLLNPPILYTYSKSAYPPVFHDDSCGQFKEKQNDNKN